MDCPVDGSTLLLSERQGIEVDYCPDCRGVWLDRGELDKLIDRSADAGGGQWRADSRAATGGQPRRKRKGWLGELFEVD
jgi:uncharacterized protein